MPEQPSNRDKREGQTKERPSIPSTPLPDRRGDQDHPQGWRAQPAPDRPGAPPSKPPGLRNIGPPFIWFVLILLALNIWVTSLTPSGPERIRVPYSPTFLTQVKGGNVESISSKGETIQGTFRHEFKYPPEGEDSKVSKEFSTEVPTFANTDALTAALEAGDVPGNAKPPAEGRSVIANPLPRFCPPPLLVGRFAW